VAHFPGSSARRRALGLLSGAILLGALSGEASAQAPTGGPTPSAPGASVYFSDMKDGAVINGSKVTVKFGLRGMSVAPAGSDQRNSGHHHLLIDTGLPPLNEPVPNDFNNLHFGAGQTEADITLTPGEHTLQLLLGDKDHVPHSPPVMSERIRVRVVDAAAGAQASAVPGPAPVRKPAPADAKVYFIYPNNGDTIGRTTVVRFGLRGMGISPAGIARPNAGHHHVLIDTKLANLNDPIPSDFNNLHFGAGQTEGEITLPLGEHTLQLVLGDENHVPHDPPVMSEVIKVTVTATGAPEAKAAPAAAPAPKAAAKPKARTQTRRVYTQQPRYYSQPRYEQPVVRPHFGGPRMGIGLGVGF
jgi:hypothetical protein